MSSDPANPNPDDPPGALPAPRIESPAAPEILPPERPAVHAMMMERSYQGPLPTAEQYRIYEDAYPGTAEFIMERARAEQAHRHAMERALTVGAVREEVRGQYMAFLIVLGLVACALYLGLHGQPWLAGVFVGATMLKVVQWFLQGRSDQGPDHDAASPPA